MVREDSNDEDGVAGADFVAVGESGFFYAGAVEESAVAAFEIDEAAAFFTVFDGEVKTGHLLIVGNGVIGLGVATDADKLAGL